MYELTDNEFNGLLALDSDYQRTFCIQKCIEHNVICLLKANNDQVDPCLLLEEEEENSEPTDEESGDESSFKSFMPIWSHPRFAELFLKNASEETRQNYEIAEMELSLFTATWVKVLLENQIGLAIMPTSKDKLFHVESADIFDSSEFKKQ